MKRLIATGALLAIWGVAAYLWAPVVIPDNPLLPVGPLTAEAADEGEQPRELSIAWVGDITPGSRYGNPLDQGRAQFARMRGPLRQHDLTIGNLEGTLSVGGASKCGTDAGQCFSFQGPPENAAAFRWAGFDLLNLANNHAFDFGPDGQRQTLEALDGQRLASTGRPGQITVVRRNGVRVATVGFAPYEWASELRDLAEVRRLVRAARRRADLVLVLAHLGGEGTGAINVPAGRESLGGEDRGDTRAFAHTAIDSGADLVLGSGPHVLRGIEHYRGKLIAYSLANFAGWGNFPTGGALGLSGLLTVRLSPDGDLRGGRLVPLRLDGPGIPTPDPSRESVEVVNELGRQDFGGAALRLLPDGSF